MSRRGTAAAVAVVLAGLALVALGARSDATRFVPHTAATPSAAVTTAPPAASAGQQNQNPTPQNPEFKGFTLFLFILMILLAGMFVVLAATPIGGRLEWRRRHARRTTDPAEPAERSTRALAEAVRQGLREVDQGAVADAIVACWLRLERAAADAGVARRDSETAAELTGRVLADHQVSPATLRRLGDLYREARYSTHPMGPAERDQARHALEQVLAELRGRPAAGHPDVRGTDGHPAVGAPG